MIFTGPCWSWSYGSWIYDYLCYQYLSPLMLWVQIPLRRDVFDTTLCDKLKFVNDLLQVGETDCHDITEILLKVALSTINQLNHIIFKAVTICYYFRLSYAFDVVVQKGNKFFGSFSCQPSVIFSWIVSPLIKSKEIDKIFNVENKWNNINYTTNIIYYLLFNCIVIYVIIIDKILRSTKMYAYK